MIATGASGLSSSTSSGGSTAAGVDVILAERALGSATGVDFVLFDLAVDGRGAGVFCGDGPRGCGVLRDDGCGGNAGAPNEKLNAAFFNSRGLELLLVQILATKVSMY